MDFKILNSLQVSLRLRFSKALTSQYTEEQDEFNFVKQLNKELNISEINKSNNYSDLDFDKYEFIIVSFAKSNL